MTQLLEAVQTLAGLRRDHHVVSQEIAGAYATLEQAMAERLTRQDQLKREIAAQEEYVRHLGVSVYEANGERSPAPGLTIRLTTTIDYDEARALGWCLDQRIVGAVKLDKPAFNKLAAVMRPPFVTVKEEVPATTIARDLDAALTAAPTPTPSEEQPNAGHP